MQDGFIIPKLERVTEEIHTMSNTMIQLVEEVKHTNETVSSLDQKVEKMDSRVDDCCRWTYWSYNYRTYLGCSAGIFIIRRI